MIPTSPALILIYIIILIIVAAVLYALYLEIKPPTLDKTLLWPYLGTQENPRKVHQRDGKFTVLIHEATDSTSSFYKTLVIRYEHSPEYIIVSVSHDFIVENDFWEHSLADELIKRKPLI